MLGGITLRRPLRANDFEYEIHDGKVTITGYMGEGGAVTVPSTLDGLPVTTIGAWAFGYCTGLTSITLPHTLTYIEENAFKYCSGLTKVYVPEKTTIVEDAFRGCVNLTTITHGDDPDQVYTADDFMFQFYTGTLVRKPRILPEWWTAQ